MTIQDVRSSEWDLPTFGTTAPNMSFRKQFVKKMENNFVAGESVNAVSKLMMLDKHKLVFWFVHCQNKSILACWDRTTWLFMIVMMTRSTFPTQLINS